MPQPPYRILFFGTPGFARTSLEALLKDPRFAVVGVVTQPDKPSGRHRQLTACPVKACALEHGLPVLQPASLRKELGSFLGSVAPWQPIDCGVVVAFGQILPRPVLELPVRGCVNVHASLLPRWRGAAPMQRALMAGDTETGICLMQMEEGLDSGPVYAQQRMPIGPATNFGELHDALAEVGAQILTKELPRIIEGSLHPVAQSPDGVTYASKISNDEARIDWSQPAQTIHNQIRALSPIPGAYTLYQGARLKIFRAAVVSRSDSSNKVAGCVLRADNVLTVQCGQHEISIEELQLEGRKRLSASELLRGVTIRPGDHLG
ncbi:MAG: methionyl-tRNA formyltransferase [Bdellovibrionota bacterium]|nr:MAG: methionyl-tRNA formyltransferase [Bdellovibrionota bacterium]